MNDQATRVKLSLPNPRTAEEEGCLDDTEEPSKELSVLLTSHNWIEGNKYYEPSTGLLFTVDPFTLATEIFKDEAVENHENLLADEAIWKAVEKYSQKTFSPKSAGFGVYKAEESIHVVLVGSRAEPKNFWSGQWLSKWTLSKDGTLEGHIRAFVHYYEEGNIELEASKKINLACDDPGKLTSLIGEAEEGFQLAMADAYQTLSQTAFKKLRRPLPITRTKMDWSKVGVYGLGSELSSMKQTK